MNKDANSVSRRDFLKGAAVGAVGVAAMGVLGACGGTQTPAATASPAAESAAQPVTASATMKGFGGDVTVTLTVLDGTITDCQIVGDGETPEVGGRAVAEMPAKFVEAGNVKVDGISGATFTSTAILGAAAKAYNEATGVKAGEISMKPGQYTASALGYWGIWELPVTITVDEKTLLKIEVPEDRFAHGETEVILQNVKEKLFPRMIENQSVTVDAIAGATVSSHAVLVSVETALKEALKAGGSDESAIEHFYRTPAKLEEGVTEELEKDLLIVGMSTGSILAMRSAMETMRSLNGNKRISILAIDKAGKYGGKSALTHEFTSVNPPKYKDVANNGENFIDAARFLNEWLSFTSNNGGVQSAKEDLVKMFFEESGKTIDWMYNLGWTFGTMKKSSMTDGFVAFNTALTSNVDIGTYEDRRGILDDYYKYLLASVAAQGGDYMLETEGYEFIMDGDTVKGVKARNNVTGKEYVIHAKAVIMATGGFGANDQMMTDLIDPRWAGPRKRLGTDMDDGKLFQAALDIGAGTWNVEMSPMVMHFGLPHFLTHFPVNFKENTLNGRTGRQETWTLNDIPLGMGIAADTVCVSKQGVRFDDESKIGQFATDNIMDSWCGSKAGQYYYSIYSKEQMDYIAENGLNNIPRWEGYCAQGGVPKDLPLPEVYECLDVCVDEGMAWKADTIADLAKQLEMDPTALSETIDAYNGYVAKGVDEEFGKDPKYLTAIGSGPYYAIKIMGVIFATAGGLDVDTQIRVLGKDHTTPIGGLYAVGNDSLGVLLCKERNYCGFGGVAQGWAGTSGRLAGIYASQYISETYGLADVSPALVDLSAFSS